MNTIVIDHVAMNTFKKRIQAYKTLLNVNSVKLEVKGTFIDKKGEIVFINTQWSEVNLHACTQQYLCVRVDEVFQAIKPLTGVILSVKLSTKK